MLNAQLVSVRSTIGIAAMMIAVAAGETGNVTARAAVPADGAAQMRAAYAKLPVAFVENRGQADLRVRYYAQGPRYAFYLTRDEIILSLVKDPAASGLALALRFPGSNPRRRLEASDRAPGDVNYFRGADPAGWRTGIPRYTQVAYRDLWPGIDLALREQAGTLKYEFVVRPGARPADIRLAWAGATGLSVDRSGGLLIQTPLGTLRDSAPRSYQIANGRRVPIDSRYALEGQPDATQYGFVLGAGYRPDRELIIDPGVEYSTFIGGSSHELAGGIRVDAAGNAYLVGTTQSPDFPTTTGAFKRTGAAGNFGDVFVSKLNAAGTALVYSTFIGGSDFDFGRDIAIDSAGNAYLTGQTKSPNFPTTAGAFDRTFNVDTCPRCGIDQYDAFVAKLNPTGSALVYSTFLGGFDIDDGLGIAVDAARNAYVTGETGSTNFPTTAGAFDRSANGSFDAFITKLNAAGSALVYSSYLGGEAVQFGSRVAVDGAGTAFIVGSTSSTAFPVTAGAFDTTANGAFDVFVTRVSASGAALLYCTYLGGDGFDSGGSVAIDAAGNAYVTGGAGSTNFPTTPGAFNTRPDGSDTFVAKLNPAGSALIYSTVVGGSSGEAGNGVVVDASGRAWLTGITNSTDFPVTPGAFDPSFNGVADAFVAGLSADGSMLEYASYFGGTQSDGGDAIAIDPGGDIYLAGHTYSLDYPTTLGAFDIVWNGDPQIFWGDAFVTKLATDTWTSTPPSVPPAPDAPALLAPANNDAPAQPIGFDWSEAAGAASYTIQIDDANTFTAPLVREQSVAASQYVTSGLATTPQFWRVRAVNTAGVAGAWSAVRRFTPQATPPPPTLGSFETNPSTVAGGEPSSGTVVLSATAPEGGAVISLSSSHPAVASVPATVTAAAHGFTATFGFSTSPVAARTVVTLTAGYNGTTRTATVTVIPAGTPAATVQNLSVTPSSVAGGGSAQGVVTLSAGAPQGGASVALTSSNPGAAAVPGSVTIGAGATIGVFNIATSAVSTATAVTISAVYNGATRTAGLTVTAAAPPPPPPQTVTLTVNATGRSGERVTSAPAGINVGTGSSGTASFTTGASVTLSVTNGRDAIWSGACSSGGSKRKSCTFTIGSAATVTANVQ